MKRLLSIILGVMLMIMPFAGCEKEKEQEPVQEMAEIYFTPPESWTFKEGEGEKTVIDINQIFSATVIVYSNDPESDIPPLYLPNDGFHDMHVFFCGILQDKLTMRKTDEVRRGEIWITLYNENGEVKTVWVTKDGEFLYYDGREYYISEKNAEVYENIRERCVKWQREYPYTLKQTGTELVLTEGEKTLMTVDMQDLSFGWMRKGYDSGVRAYIDSPLREEMVLSALRLTEEKTFRKAFRSYSSKMIMFEICYGGKYYDVSVLPDGALSIGYQEGEVYNHYITNYNVVNYNLFLELFNEWS